MARHTPVVLIAALFLIPGVASAQVMGAAKAPGYRYNPPPPKPEPPASRPEPRVDSPRHHDRFDTFRPAPGEDLFRAGPDTYKPRPVRDNRRAVFIPTFVTREVVIEPVIVERTRVVVVEKPVERPPAEPEPAASVEAPALPPPALVTARRTIYVIPRCYMGDRPPEPSRLPAGCDVRDVKLLSF